MERVLTAHRQLRCILWIVEAAIITICLITAAQIGTEKGGSIWACGPIAIIAAFETMRVPLAGWAAHLRPMGMLGAFIVMAAIAFMTFEGMAMGVERFMNNRVVDVVEARVVLNDAQEAEAHYATDFKRLKGELDATSDLLTKVQGQVPAPPAVAATVLCPGGFDKKHKRQFPAYACGNKQGEAEASAYGELVKAHNADLRKAEDSRAKAETALNALPKPDPDAVRKAEKALERAAAGSTMYRSAAAWFGTPVKELTDAQFQRFKRIAVVTVSASAAVGTMVVAFVSHATPRDPSQKNKLVRAIRAWIARKRKQVVKTVIKTTEKRVEVPVEVEKHVFVDKPVIVEKPVPGPERVVIKHIHVPVDINTWRVVNRDGTLSDEVISPLHVVQGGKS
jgi:hypothetical protein